MIGRAAASPPLPPFFCLPSGSGSIVAFPDKGIGNLRANVAAAHRADHQSYQQSVGNAQVGRSPNSSINRASGGRGSLASTGARSAGP